MTLQLTQYVLSAYDTLGTLAVAFDMSIKDLIDVNHDLDVTKELVPGDVITVLEWRHQEQRPERESPMRADFLHEADQLDTSPLGLLPAPDLDLSNPDLGAYQACLTASFSLALFHCLHLTSLPPSHCLCRNLRLTASASLLVSQPPPDCLHLTSLPPSHCLHLTSLPPSHCLHLTVCTWLPAPHYLHLAACTSLSAPHCLHLTACVARSSNRFLDSRACTSTARGASHPSAPAGRS